MSAAFVVVVGLLVLTNLLNHVWLPKAYLVTCPVVAVVLVVVGRAAGLSWTELGMGRSSLLKGVLWAVGATALVALGYTVALALPFVRSAAGPPPGTREAMFVALVEVPFGTVLLEEVAFRGVLWGLVARDHGAWAATFATAGLFGVWHVPAALADDGVSRPARLTGSRWGTTVWVLGTVLFTAAAGVVFGEVRRRSGSVFAAMGLHWATNGLGTLFRLVAPARRPVRPAAAPQGP
jgi:membrane protease YdiL (CAAX protease family)